MSPEEQQVNGAALSTRDRLSQIERRLCKLEDQLVQVRLSVAKWGAAIGVGVVAANAVLVNVLT
jgi:hypothetical protein